MEKIDCFHLGVKALLLNSEKKILLLERDHKIKNKYWDLPGGRLQRGESLIDTLRREVKEETGLDKIHQIRPLTMVLTDFRIPENNEDVGLIFSIFICDVSLLFTPKLSHEHTHFAWYSPAETAKKLNHYPPEFIEKLSSLS